MVLPSLKTTLKQPTQNLEHTLRASRVMKNRVNPLKSLKLIQNHARYQEKQISFTKKVQFISHGPVGNHSKCANPSKTEFGAYFVGL